MNSDGKSYRTWVWASCLGALSLLGGAACAQILGLEEWNGGSTSASGGAAGTGGMSASSSSSATASSSSASAGGGGPSSSAAMSASASVAVSSSGTGGPCPCPPGPTECSYYACVANQCMLTNIMVGFLS